MKILRQFIKARALDDFLPSISDNCCRKFCPDCLYWDGVFFSPAGDEHCPLQSILAEKLGLPMKEVRRPSAWAFPQEEGSIEQLPALRVLETMDLKEPEHVKSLVVRR